LARVKHADFLSIKSALQERLLNEIGEHLAAGLNHEDVSAVVKEFTARILESEHIPLNQAEQGR
ncbi:MAG: hypothetical protein KC584_06415, partial [Nitrospira sp.]|nr:hypothetical protein [Nitrospira sp.]